MLDEQDLTPTFVSTAVFTTPPTTTILTDIDNGIIDGHIYRFRWLATNAYGNGEFSDEIRVAAVSKLSAPLLVTKDLTLSSENRISV